MYSDVIQCHSLKKPHHSQYSDVCFESILRVSCLHRKNENLFFCGPFRFKAPQVWIVKQSQHDILIRKSFDIAGIGCEDNFFS